MNYLAHAWLARQSDDALLGGLLGDFVHGQAALADWPDAVRAEIVRHRRIDRYTDDHPAVAAARARFGGLRRYAGIVLDVYFDHRLASGWTRWNAAPLPAFTARVYRILEARRADLPPRLAALAPRMAAHDWLGSYAHRASVDHAVRGIATRLSRNGDRLVACLEVLAEREPEMAAAFEAFFPDLLAFAGLDPGGRARTGPEESAGRIRGDGGNAPHPHDEER
ncbi:MAG TPA: ACP phosphodiesterase [Thermomonas sp.]|nr:ACP phosphodiesterase [Thermomonas sp.]